MSSIGIMRNNYQRTTSYEADFGGRDGGYVAVQSGSV
jgi:hypothetical protein